MRCNMRRRVYPDYRYAIIDWSILTFILLITTYTRDVRYLAVIPATAAVGAAAGIAARALRLRSLRRDFRRRFGAPRTSSGAVGTVDENGWERVE